MSGNLLGDIRAEQDGLMLDAAFVETSDYKALLENPDRCIVVGRRGTGKSALVYRLNKHWVKEPQTFCFPLSPDEDQVIGLRVFFTNFHNNFVHIKAASKLAWRYALYMELLTVISNHYKLKKYIDTQDIGAHIVEWNKPKKNIAYKLRSKLRKVIDLNDNPENIIADLSDCLELDVLEDILENTLSNSKYTYRILVDRLDEGYTPDDIGVALVDGFVQAIIDLNAKFKGAVNALVFLRDNMFRSIALQDPDFTRNIEGQVLRLHWDDYGLFNLVCNRLRSAHGISQENNARVWNLYASKELKGREGFRTTLRLTLYRPRDILVLLNNAYHHASQQDRNDIILADVESSAKSISENRLHDLHKEYESVFPALPFFTSAIANGSPELSVQLAGESIDTVLHKDDHEAGVQRDLSFFEDYLQVLQRLYGIGFIGVYDNDSNAFVFCHDGRAPSKEVTEGTSILIHPCYWLALNLNEKTLDVNQAEDIFDEYDIEVSSISVEQRASRIGRILEEIKHIECGKKGAHEFEKWCHNAIRLIFAGALSNIELQPNRGGRQQRDIVATNMAGDAVWERILKDYSSRQVIFEIKNFEDLSGDEYRQMNSYLSKEYGKLGFVITRASDNNLMKDKDLDWTKDLYFNHGGKIVIKLSVRYLTKHLSKLRSPQKHDAANIELNKLLDTYIRKYLIIKAR